MTFRKILATILLSTFCTQFFSQSSARDLGKLPTFSDRGDISESIKTKENISTRISGCYATYKKQPNVSISGGESLLLPFLDYLCVIDNNNLLLVMEDWVGINKLDDLTKNEEVFRIGDQIHIKGTDPNSQIAPFAKVVNNFIAKYPRVPDHKFRFNSNKPLPTTELHRRDFNGALVFNPFGGTLADKQIEKATNIYGDYDPNRFKIKKINKSEKKVYYPPAPYRDLVSSEFSEVNNLTYSPKPGFERNNFLVENLGENKFKISLVGVEGNKPYIDFAWRMTQSENTLDTHNRFKGLELLSVCNDEMNQMGVSYKQCVIRQYVNAETICDLKNPINVDGTVKCESTGSFGNNWNNYIKPVDTNLIAGIVSAMIIEDPRFQDILK